MKNLDIIIPVYRGLEETKECIYSLLPSMPEWAQLIVINDCSPEPELTKWLKEQEEPLGFKLYENKDNKGFVGTVNFGMALHTDRDVLLLNSDVEVANSDWLERMRVAAYHHERVASLTPFSNNATICSFPNFCQDNELYLGMDVNTLDKHFSNLSLTEKLVEVPTGVGFCMYIRRDCLDAVGYFDEKTFGKGYGEENDWCQRAIKLGWKNYHQLNVFAFHKGGVSFQAEGDPRKEKALELLTALHPKYITDVHKFITNDPAKKARVLAKIEAISSLCIPKIVLVTHRLGGGVSQHIDELCVFFKNKAWFIKIEPEKDGESVAITLDLLYREKTEKLIFNVATQSDELVSVLSALGISHFHFHHTMGIHPFIWSIPKKLGVEYDITIHDYYMINGNPTLTDGRGIFVGENLSTRDSLCAEHYPIPTTAKIWREGVKPLLSDAKRVIFPSSDCANRFTATFDYIKDKTIISYHPDALSIREHIMATPVTLSVPDDRALRVLVLGALSREKGANLLERVAKECPEIEFHLLGYAYRPLDAVIGHGAYNQDNLDILIDDISPDIVWFPALWPETYSYTLSIALRHNMPVICPNIGAFPERIVGREFSFLVPWDYQESEYVAYWRALSAKQMDSISLISENIIKNISKNMALSNSYDFYLLEYVESIDVSMVPKIEVKNLECVLEAVLKPQYTSVKTVKEQVLIKMWAIRNSWIGRRLAKVVPFTIQRKIKRYLSHKPLHDIL